MSLLTAWNYFPDKCYTGLCKNKDTPKHVCEKIVSFTVIYSII